MFGMYKIKKTVSLLFVALFTSYYVNTNFFIHTHHDASGLFTHSHPYSSANHSHSANTLQLIESLTSLLFTGSIAIFYFALLSVSKTSFSSIKTQHAALLLIGGNQLRAPPVRVSSLFPAFVTDL